MNTSSIILLFFALLTATSYTKVEGTVTVFLTPSVTNVILGKAITLECYTYESIYTSLSFIFHTRTNSTKTTPVVQFNGGIRRTTTFTMTADLNATQLSCAASGPGGAYSTSQIVEILVQDPKQINDVDVCKLGRQVFFSWNSVFALLGINVSYIINDNYGHQNMIINKSHYSIQLNDELDYESNIVVIFNASAFNQVAYSEPKTIHQRLSGTNLKLNVSSVYLKNRSIQFDFTSVLSDLNECSFDYLTDETLIACDHNDGSTCKNYSASVQYQEKKGELVFSSTLDLLRQKFNSSLSFDYIGVKIETDNASISTHFIQSLNFSQGCAYFSILGDNEIPVALYFQHESEEKLVHKFNISKSNSLLCSPIVHNQTHNISFSEGISNWIVSVYDMSDEKEQGQPAVELHNVDVTVNTILVSPPEVTSSEQTASSSFISTATRLDVLLIFCLFINKCMLCY